MTGETVTVEIDQDTANAIRRLHEMAGLSTDADDLDLDLDQLIYELIEEGHDNDVRLLKLTRDDPILTDEESSAVPRFRDNRADYRKL